jgi:hypothetical protein
MNGFLRWALAPAVQVQACSGSAQKVRSVARPRQTALGRNLTCTRTPAAVGEVLLPPRSSSIHAWVGPDVYLDSMRSVITWGVGHCGASAVILRISRNKDMNYERKRGGENGK